jgi:predicted ATPase
VKASGNLKYVITGGPGSGKTSIIDALSKMGYKTFDEVSRKLIRQQSLLEDGAFPWKNTKKFADLALLDMEKQFLQAQHESSLTFFDRGIPDISGYLHFTGIPVSATISDASNLYRYASHVFICPPWPEIYTNDPERPQTSQDAIDLYHYIHTAYKSLGYILTEVPIGTLAERVEFILNTTKAHHPALVH